MAYEKFYSKEVILIALLVTLKKKLLKKHNATKEFHCII